MPHVDTPRQRKDGTWSVRVRYWVGDRQPSQWFRGFATAKDCLQAATHWANDYDRRKWLGTLTPTQLGSELTGGELVERWFDDHVNVCLDKDTRENYRAVVPIYYTPFFGEDPIGDLTPADGFAWRKWLIEEAAKRSPVSDPDQAGIPTVNKMLSIGKSIFSFAVVNQWIPGSPLEKIKPLKYRQEKRKKSFAPTPEHAEAIRSVISIARLGTRLEWILYRDRLVVSLLAYLGLRQEEAFSADWWQAIDDNGAPRRRLLIPEGKTDASEREPNCWRQVREEIGLFYKLMGEPDLDSPILHGPRGARLTRHNWRRDSWLPALADARTIRGYENLQHFGPHRLRAGAATMLGYALWPTHEVLDFLGHTDHTTTVKFYLRAFRDAEDRRGVPVEEQIDRARATLGHTLPAIAA